MGYRDRGGYGRDEHNLYAHRLAWEAEHGPIPEKHSIHHHCGNKPCLNVEHMELLTTSDHCRLHALEKWGPEGALRKAVR